MQDPTELSLVSTETLLDELEKRSDALVFATYQNRRDDLTLYHRRWGGGLIPCLGLVGLLDTRIRAAMDEMDRVEEEPDGTL